MLNNVSLQIRNPENGQLVPCWISLRDSNGKDHAPDGWLGDFSVLPGEDVGGRGIAVGRRWFAISGSCEVPGGLGECELRISRAPAFACLTTAIKLFPGRLACRISFCPPSMPWENWIAADLRAHSCGVGGLLVESQSGGLQLVCLVAGNSLGGDDSKPELKALAEIAGFGGACDRSGILISPGTLNRQKRSGSLVLLDSHRPVFPLVIDEANRRDWSLMDWTGQGHRIRGLTVWADLGRDEFHCGEALCAAILGEIDLFEVVDLDPLREGGLSLWRDLAAAGFPIPLVGSTAKDSNATCLGGIRTWIEILEPGWAGKTPAEKQSCWVRAVKAGKTQASRWPLVIVKNLRLEGEELALEFEIHGAVEGARLELISNSGDEVLAIQPDLGHNSGALSLNFAGKNPGLLAPRLRDKEGNIVVQASWQAVAGEDLSQRVDGEAIGRLARRIQQAMAELDSWEEAKPGSGEIVYRRGLFMKSLETLKEKLTLE